jgi:hypothetical protein
MTKQILVVLSEPVDGKEDEFNDWYNNIHLAEVVQVKGFVQAQRFKVADDSAGLGKQRYIAIYECEGDDVEALRDGLMATAPSFNMGSSIDLDNVGMQWATAISPLVER